MKFDHFSIRHPLLTDTSLYFQLIANNISRLEDFFAGTVAKNKTQEATQNFLEETLQKMENNLYLAFIIIDNNTQAIIGFIDVKNIDWGLPKAELGCFIDKHYANMGVSHKALTLVIEYLFSNYNFHKLFLRTHESNQAARMLAENCGFKLEGILREDYRTTKGELVDLMYYGLLKQ